MAFGNRYPQAKSPALISSFYSTSTFRFALLLLLATTVSRILRQRATTLCVISRGARKMRRYLPCFSLAHARGEKVPTIQPATTAIASTINDWWRCCLSRGEGPLGFLPFFLAIYLFLFPPPSPSGSELSFGFGRKATKPAPP